MSKRALIFIGPQDCGKTTLANTLTKIFDPSLVSFLGIEDMDTIFERSAVMGKHINYTTDANKDWRTAGTWLKQVLTGSGDVKTRAQVKNKEAVTFVAKTGFLMDMNDAPRFSDAHGALWQRLSMIRLKEDDFARIDIDKMLENELSRIICWVASGITSVFDGKYMRWHDLPSSLVLKSEIREEFDPFERIKPYYEYTGNPKDMVPCDDIYKLYESKTLDVNKKLTRTGLSNKFTSFIQLKYKQSQFKSWQVRNNNSRSYVYRGIRRTDYFDMDDAEGQVLNHGSYDHMLAS